MRRWFSIVLIALFAASLLVAGCPKKQTVKDAPESGEEGPDQGPDIPGPR